MGSTRKFGIISRLTQARSTDAIEQIHNASNPSFSISCRPRILRQNTSLGKKERLPAFCSESTLPGSHFPGSAASFRYTNGSSAFAARQLKPPRWLSFRPEARFNSLSQASASKTNTPLDPGKHESATNPITMPLNIILTTKSTIRLESIGCLPALRSNSRASAILKPRQHISRLSTTAQNRQPLPIILQPQLRNHQLPLIQHATIRRLHLAPPFLVDQYTPRYQLLSSVDAAKKRSLAYAHLSQCNLCPRNCNVNRYEKLGVCNIGAETAKVATIAPHFGEEPCIQGHHGSGSVFLSSCNLRCVFCQNYDTAHTAKGFDLTPEQLAEWYIKLVEVGNVHNINLVTPEHVVPQVVLSILAARDMGLNVPIVYNTSAYDSINSLEILDGLIDIYLPDFKVWKPSTARRLLKADNYVDSAKESIKEMHRQVGDLRFTPDGIACSGILVRHLVMPGYQDEGRKIMQWLRSEEGLGTDVFVNIMEQYFPSANVGKPKHHRKQVKVQEPGGSSMPDGEAAIRYQDINRRVEKDEIETVRQAAEAVGIWRFCDPPKHDGFNI